MVQGNEQNERINDIQTKNLILFYKIEINYKETLGV
jgi:hypothetical protein